MTAAERTAAMRAAGVFWCPPWCVQDPEEDQYEQHWSGWGDLVTADGDTVQVRVRESWWADRQLAQDQVEVRFVFAPGTSSPGDPPGEELGARFNGAELTAFRTMLDTAEAMLNSDGEKPAYDGADDEAEIAELAAARAGAT